MNASQCVRCGAPIDPAKALYSEQGLTCEKCHADRGLAELEHKGRRNKGVWIGGAVLVLGGGGVGAFFALRSPDYEAMAQRHLAGDGYVELALTKDAGKDKQGAFTFRAKDANGKLCEGTIGVSGSESSASYIVFAECHHDEAKCTAGDATACVELAAEAAKRDPDKALALREKACDIGSGSVCNDVGVAYAKGEGAPKDEAKGAALFGKACDAANALGCRNLAISRENGAGVKKDAGAALVAYERACSLGDAESCEEAGVAHTKGLGTERDPKKAGPLFDKACKASVKHACGNFGYILAQSELADEVARGQTLLEEACGRDEAGPCANLGILLGKGKLKGDDDGKKRAGFYDKACRLGNAAACNNLGVMVEGGQGGRVRDLATAVTLYDQACTLGDPTACFNVGTMVKSGRGAPRDLARARTAFEKGCQAGDKDCCDAVAKLPKP
ncbi:MAG: sel1 repeat family protein [Myxococcales bacterium]|nr:sel1 repeat family protein [Myxococcales bacterium]